MMDFGKMRGNIRGESRVRESHEKGKAMKRAAGIFSV